MTFETMLGIGPFETPILWKMVFRMAVWHIFSLYGVYLALFYASYKLILLTTFLGIANGVSITAGVHRLYSHKAYKARWPLRLIFMLLQTMAMQMSMVTWIRTHRLHHKYAETNGDPHNINRGFFFAHIGWTMCEKHPDLVAKENTIEMDDAYADPIVKFQDKFFHPLIAFFWLYLPTMLPYWLFGEPIYICFFVNTMLRYVIQLHGTWMINSVSHSEHLGYRPFNRFIKAIENKWACIPMGITGEGWHNYHHTFPWDYSASEYGWNFNLATMVIDCSAKIGLAYDLKRADQNTIIESKRKRGDGTRLHEHGN